MDSESNHLVENTSSNTSLPENQTEPTPPERVVVIGAIGHLHTTLVTRLLAQNIVVVSSNAEVAVKLDNFQNGINNLYPYFVDSREMIDAPASLQKEPTIRPFDRQTWRQNEKKRSKQAKMRR